MTPKPIFKRILLKLSGEVMSGAQGYGVDPARAQEIAREIREVHELGVDIALVIGGAIFSAGWVWRPRKWTAWLPTTWECWPL